MNIELKSKQHIVIGILVLAIALLISGSFYFSALQKKNQLQADQVIYDSIPTQTGKNNFMKQSANLTKAVDPELVDLDSQISTCGASVDSLLSDSPTYENSCVGASGSLSGIQGLYMGGQCCSALTDLDDYHNNLKKLQAYKDMPNIPLDPMHTPVEMAKMWIDYDNKTKLTAIEQKVYDDAFAISKEKPCCCKCWHYFVNEGIAKKMIKDGQYNSLDIANYWDASDICGS